MTYKLRAFILLILLASQVVYGQGDSTVILRLRDITVSSVTGSLQTRSPSYASFVDNFSRANTLSTPGTDFTIDEGASFSSSHSGFRITFSFQSDWLDQDRFFDFFTFAFETGSQELNLFRLTSSDSNHLDYRMDNEVFRLAFGAKKMLTKKNKRFQFYTGFNWIHEFHVSSFVTEELADRELRRLFAQKNYSLYLNAPIGLAFRFRGKKEDFKKYKAVFFELLYGVGIQNTDPFSLLGFYSGTSLGLAFSI